MKKRIFNRLILLLMTTCLCMSSVMVGTTIPVEAKAAPKLSAKSVTIAMGGKQTIKLKNGKGRWTIKNNGVAKIKSKTKTSATIKPLKAGTTTLSCKVGKKTLKCKIKVLNNKVGNTDNLATPVMIVGKNLKWEYNVPEGFKYWGTDFDKNTGNLKVTPNSDNTKLTIELKAKNPGLFEPVIIYENEEGDLFGDRGRFVFINGFRGKAKDKKTDAKYKAWRKKTISTMVSADMTTWEIINAIGTLISTGKYSMKGGATGKQLWYGGNGTCVSGAMMMDDFLKDMGVTSKVRFAGNDKPRSDIFGASLWYGSQHKNVAMTLGGKKYYLNPQPGFQWPYGIIKR